MNETEYILTGIMVYVFGYALAYMLRNIGSHWRRYNIFYVIFGVPILVTLLVGAESLRSGDNLLLTGVFVLGMLVQFFKDGIFRDFIDDVSFWFYRCKREADTARNSEQEAHYSRQAEDEAKRAYQEREEELNQREREWKRREEEVRREREREKENTEKEQTTGKPYSDRVNNRTPEEVLGLKAGFSQKELKDAYRRECARVHPDKWANKPESLKIALEEEQKLVNWAYGKLKN